MNLTNHSIIVFRSSWLAILLCAITFFVGHLSAQEANRSIDQTFEFDERGDAKITITFQYGAAQWAQWKEEYGDHPDMVLRNIRYQFASAVIEDFSMQRDDVKRIATGKMKALSLARYRSGGQFSISVPKNMKLVAGSGLEWVFTNSSIMNRELVSQTLRAKLPANAHDAHFVSGGDFDQLAYTLDVSPARSPVWLVLGVLFLIAAITLLAVSFIINKSSKSDPIIPPPPKPPSPPPLTLPTNI